jgi:hypothetical protein
LLRNLPKQMSRKTLDQGRQNLWPSNSTNGRNPDFDPYVHLYGAITSIGSAAYRNFSSEIADPTKGFLAALRTSVQNCSTSHLAVYLRKTQDVVRVWIEDSEKKMHSKEPALKALHGEVSCSSAFKLLPILTTHRSSLYGERLAKLLRGFLAKTARFCFT